MLKSNANKSRLNSHTGEIWIVTLQLKAREIVEIVLISVVKGDWWSIISVIESLSPFELVFRMREAQDHSTPRAQIAMPKSFELDLEQP